MCFRGMLSVEVLEEAAKADATGETSSKESRRTHVSRWRVLNEANARCRVYLWGASARRQKEAAVRENTRQVVYDFHQA